MEIGGVTRASAVATTSVVSQQQTRNGEVSAAPGLRPEQTVQAVNSTEAVGVEISYDATTAAQRLETMRQIIARRVEVDPRTRQLLFQSVRQRTGEVIQQLPSEVSLKLRAYLASSGMGYPGLERDMEANSLVAKSGQAV